MEQSFLDLVKAFDNQEMWARQKISEMWNSNDATLLPRVDEARIELYSAAADLGDKNAQYLLGMSLRHTNMQKSLKLLGDLAEQGDIRAMKQIAIGYTENGGYGDDEENYLYWYERAAVAGDAEAQNTVANEYRYKHVYQTACEWYMKSSEQGYIKAYLGLAVCYNSRKMNAVYQENTGKDQAEPLSAKELDSLEEQAYVEVINRAETEEQYGDACMGLANIYSSALIDKPMPNRAAYFYYKAYLCGRSNAYNELEKIEKKYQFSVDKNDIEAWAHTHGVYGGEEEETQNPEKPQESMIVPEEIKKEALPKAVVKPKEASQPEIIIQKYGTTPKEVLKSVPTAQKKKQGTPKSVIWGVVIGLAIVAGAALLRGSNSSGGQVTTATTQWQRDYQTEKSEQTAVADSQEEPAEVPFSVADAFAEDSTGDYILPDSSSVLIDHATLNRLSQTELRLARNEIFARHGRRFTDPELQAYFDGKSWYSGTIASDAFDVKVLSQVEKDNVAALKAKEDN